MRCGRISTSIIQSRSMKRGLKVIAYVCMEVSEMEGSMKRGLKGRRWIVS